MNYAFAKITFSIALLLAAALFVRKFAFHHTQNNQIASTTQPAAPPTNTNPFIPQSPPNPANPGPTAQNPPSNPGPVAQNPPSSAGPVAQTPPANPNQAPTALPNAPNPTPAANSKKTGTIRIAAGSHDPITDSQGNVWQADRGFIAGDVVARDSVNPVNASVPEICSTEHWGMSGFHEKVPNGQYTVILHFIECSPLISDVGQRVFSLDVNGIALKDLDVFKESGGFQHALDKTFQVTVTNKLIQINFHKQIQETEINGIEIIPAN